MTIQSVQKMSNKMKSGDKRKYERIFCRFPVTVILNDGQKILGWAQNISPNGLSLSVPRGSEESTGIKKESKVKVVLNSPFFKFDALPDKSYTVITADELPGGEALYGLELLDTKTLESGNAFTIIRPSDYVLSNQMEREFLKILELINLQVSNSQAKIISITAAQEKAGTSTFSWWLSSCLARIKNTRVLYVDANLQKIDVSEQTGKENFLGVLHDQVDLSTAVVNLGFGAPDVLNSGCLGDYQAGEISELRLKNILEKMRGTYDYVVIDTLPASDSPFGLLITKLSDGALFVIESQKTNQSVAKRALDMLRSVGCNIIGVLLNKVG